MAHVGVDVRDCRHVEVGSVAPLWNDELPLAEHAAHDILGVRDVHFRALWRVALVAPGLDLTEALELPKQVSAPLFGDGDVRRAVQEAEERLLHRLVARQERRAALARLRDGDDLHGGVVDRARECAALDRMGVDVRLGAGLREAHGGALQPLLVAAAQEAVEGLDRALVTGAGEVAQLTVLGGLAGQAVHEGVTHVAVAASVVQPKHSLYSPLRPLPRHRTARR